MKKQLVQRFVAALKTRSDELKLDELVMLDNTLRSTIVERELTIDGASRTLNHFKSGNIIGGLFSSGMGVPMGEKADVLGAAYKMESSLFRQIFGLQGYLSYYNVLRNELLSNNVDVMEIARAISKEKDLKSIVMRTSMREGKEITLDEAVEKFAAEILTGKTLNESVDTIMVLADDNKYNGRLEANAPYDSPLREELNSCFKRNGYHGDYGYSSYIKDDPMAIVAFMEKALGLSKENKKEIIEMGQ